MKKVKRPSATDRITETVAQDFAHTATDDITRTRILMSCGHSEHMHPNGECRFCGCIGFIGKATPDPSADPAQGSGSATEMKEERLIYVVIGSSGDYEDYRTWPVAAFAFRDRAERFAVAAFEWSHAACEHFRSLDLEWPDVDRWLDQNPSPYDPNWDRQSDTAYRVLDVPAAPSVDVKFTPKRFRRKQARLSEAV